MLNRNSMLAVVVVISASGSATVADVNMQYVLVDDPGNAADDTSYGTVDYVYRIGKHEVTNAQYCEFLNAVAKTDTYGLYNTDMGGGWNDIGGISQTGPPGNYEYSVRLGRENNPVNYVCWYDAIRFANWMTNGQGNGDTESGSYTIVGGGHNSGTVTIPDHSAFTQPHVVLPTENEWYKAAYYKGDGTNAGYWDYATQRDSPPTPEPPPGTDMVNGSANYAWAVGPPDYTTPVGTYNAKPSDSAYGTYDQNGNLHEWTETFITASNPCVRGGSYGTGSEVLHASFRDSAYDASIDATRYGLGFRVAEVPEPATLSLLALGGLAMTRRRRGRR